MIPVSDLATSAAWYRDLLDLEYVREFSDGSSVTGCSLADFSAGYLIALRLRSTTAGRADLRGEHPIILEAADAAAAARVRARAEALGIPVTSGRHAAGSWMELLDRTASRYESCTMPRAHATDDLAGGSNLYPRPRMVTIETGEPGFSSTLARSRLMWTSRVFVSPT